MYGQYGHKVLNYTLASGASLSDAIPVLGANQVMIEFATMTSGTNLKSATANAYIQVCNTSTGTFRRLVVAGQYSAGSGLKDWEVPQFSGNRIVMGPTATGNWAYMKVEMSISALTAGYSFAVHILQ